jgi:putative mRNA 3-end processing factor
MSDAIPKPESWLQKSAGGLYCVPGDFHVDPVGRVARAVISHGHSDHARPGHDKVLAAAETIAMMRVRYGADACGSAQAAAYGETVRMGDVAVRLVPAGHVLGSAQIVLEYRGSRVVVSGDYKRRRDPTCPPFEPVPCDVFITEATFGLPVFRHPPDGEEIAKVLHSLRIFPERTHLIGVYALGKCQRVIALLREAGWTAPIFLHGALQDLCDLYASFGVALGPLLPATGQTKEALKGQIVLAPPSALGDRWSRRLNDPVLAMASGWMRVRARARQRGAELPLIISDHADWDELLATADDVGSPRVWVTHGREEALLHALAAKGFETAALNLVGFEEEDS